MTSHDSLNIIRPEKTQPLGAVTVLSARGSENDVVAAANPLEPPKMRIPVAGNTDVSRFARQAGALDVAYALIQRAVVRAFQQNIGELQAGHFELSQDLASLQRGAGRGTAGLWGNNGFLLIA